MINFFKSLLGMDKVVDSGMKIVDRIAGTDWLPDKKADFILKYMEATKHQSPARRMIAFMFAFVWVLMVAIWLLSTAAFHLLGSQSSLGLADSVLEFMGDHVTQPMNIIVAFYFVTHIIKK
jgi:hypothetical protein